MKILDVNYPPVTADMNHAPLLSIISGKNDYLPWLFHNYAQMYTVGEQLQFLPLEGGRIFPFCPFVEIQHLNKEIVGMYEPNIIKFIIDCIDKGFYVLLALNSSLVSNYQLDPEEMNPHHMFIFGYEEELEVFHVGDFFRKEDYKFTTASYVEIERAYRDDDYGDLHQYFAVNVLLYKPKKCDMYYLDVPNFKELLKDYAYSRNTLFAIYNKPEYKYGQQAVKWAMLTQLAYFFEGKHADHRVFPFYKEHMKVLTMSAKYMTEKKMLAGGEKLIQEFEQLEGKAKYLIHMLMKIVMTGQLTPKNEELCTNYINEMFEQEQVTFHQYIEAIKQESEYA